MKNSVLAGHYNVAFGLSGDNSGIDWSVKEVSTSSTGTCSPEQVNVHDILQTTGLSSVSSSGSSGTSGTSGTSGHFRKVIADFGEKLLVMPCVDIRNSAFNGYYHVVMALAGDNSGSRWKVTAVNPSSANACAYNEAEDINDDKLLQANDLSSVGVLGQQ